MHIPYNKWGIIVADLYLFWIVYADISFYLQSTVSLTEQECGKHHNRLLGGRMMVIEKSGPGILKLAADVNEWYRTCLAWACIPVTQAKIRENFSRLILLTCNQNYSSIWCKRVGILGYNVSSKQMWVAWGHIVSK